MNNPTTPPSEATEEELVEVLAFLRSKAVDGDVSRLNTFELSIATQLAKKGTLSRKQVDAILRSRDREIEQETYPGPDKIPAGFYAIETPIMGWQLVRVWRPKDNVKVVRCYLLSGEADEKGTMMDTGRTLAMIMAMGPFESAKAYGGRTGKCSQCAKRLSNALSRKLRIGPVCLGRFVPDPLEKMMLKGDAEMWLELHGIDPKVDLPVTIDLDALEAAEATV